MMFYEDSVILDNYFFEADGLGNINVYKVGTMEYVDLIHVSYRYDRFEFLDNCKEWIRKKNKELYI
ncbi:TPA: hypothetical protein N2D04_002538 [Clostridium botulinum]|nr:hypothetical protein [Clostridium botulinum]HCL4458423.1 hypothetical protein [Clostridium botulinum]HCL4462335.1 hypothetical protein [Clostridium botulinum]HCL4473394.1 hypothetical protein [Clostridium botulinum]HCL4476985.1 hypothetical protein [Clostridium botulinum]